MIIEKGSVDEESSLTPDEVDDRIESWHKILESDQDIPLHEYLGWSWEEMKIWVERGVIP